MARVGTAAALAATLGLAACSGGGGGSQPFTTPFNANPGTTVQAATRIVGVGDSLDRRHAVRRHGRRRHPRRHGRARRGHDRPRPGDAGARLLLADLGAGQRRPAVGAGESRHLAAAAVRAARHRRHPGQDQQRLPGRSDGRVPGPARGGVLARRRARRPPQPADHPYDLGVPGITVARDRRDVPADLELRHAARAGRARRDRLGPRGARAQLARRRRERRLLPGAGQLRRAGDAAPGRRLAARPARDRVPRLERPAPLRVRERRLAAGRPGLDRRRHRDHHQPAPGQRREGRGRQPGRRARRGDVLPGPVDDRAELRAEPRRLPPGRDPQRRRAAVPHHARAGRRDPGRAAEDRARLPGRAPVRAGRGTPRRSSGPTATSCCRCCSRRWRRSSAASRCRSSSPPPTRRARARSSATRSR